MRLLAMIHSLVFCISTLFAASDPVSGESLKSELRQAWDRREVASKPHEAEWIIQRRSRSADFGHPVKEQSGAGVERRIHVTFDGTQFRFAGIASSPMVTLNSLAIPSSRQLSEHADSQQYYNSLHSHFQDQDVTPRLGKYISLLAAGEQQHIWHDLDQDRWIGLIAELHRNDAYCALSEFQFAITLAVYPSLRIPLGPTTEITLLQNRPIVDDKQCIAINVDAKTRPDQLRVCLWISDLNEASVLHCLKFASNGRLHCQIDVEYDRGTDEASSPVKVNVVYVNQSGETEESLTAVRISQKKLEKAIENRIPAGTTACDLKTGEYFVATASGRSQVAPLTDLIHETSVSRSKSLPRNAYTGPVQRVYRLCQLAFSWPWIVVVWGALCLSWLFGNALLKWLLKKRDGHLAT